MVDAAVSGEVRLAHPWLHRVVFGLDRLLQRRYSVSEFSEHPDCIFRVGVSRLPADLVLPDGAKAAAGDRVLILHLWNEHIPLMPTGGATLGWARRMDQCVDLSLRELARWLATRRELDDISLIHADAVFGTADQAEQMIRLARRKGFDILPAPPPSVWKRLHQLGENVLISLMVLARNPAALRLDSLWRDRVHVVMTRRALMSRASENREIR